MFDGSALLRLNVEEMVGDRAHPRALHTVTGVDALSCGSSDDTAMTLAQARYDQIALLAQAIRTALTAELDKLGFAPGSVPVGDPATAAYRLERDPACGEHSLVGEWRDAKGQKLGGLVFHEDGSFFVEYDVICTHPRNDRWFVEAVNAWGRDADIRAEARLLPLPE